MAKKLDESAIHSALQGVEGWVLIDNAKIKKDFKFDDFEKAFAFMTACAQYAEEINHHPEWTNVYHKVSVTLNTHDVGGLSSLDFDMASFMDRLSKT